MKNPIGKLYSLRRERRGSAMLEFAIGSGILVAAFTGVFQFGYTFLQYNDLENAVIQGARYASLRPYDSDSTTPSSAFSTAVENMVVYGTPSPASGATPVVYGLTTSNVNLTVAAIPGGTSATFAPGTMTVSISGFTINSIFGSVTLQNKPQVAYAYQGIFEP